MMARITSVFWGEERYDEWIPPSKVADRMSTNVDPAAVERLAAQRRAVAAAKDGKAAVASVSGPVLVMAVG